MQAVFAFVFMHILLLAFTVNSTAVSVAFPNITSSFNTSLVLAGWVLSIYQLVSAGSVVLMGKVSDILGRKKTFILCAGFFIGGSLFAALAPNIYLLIVARFIQGVGGGGLLPAMIGILYELFPRHRLQATGLSMSIANIGGIIGPNIGSWLVSSFGWQSIFWLNVPIGIVSTIPLFYLLKSELGKKVRIDFAGAGYLIAFLFAFLIGLSQIANSGTGYGWLMPGILLIISAFFITFFVRHELNFKEPIIELDLLRLKSFAAANVYNMILGSVMFGFSSFIPLYAVNVYRMTTIQSGYVLMSNSIGFILAAATSSLFLVGWGYRKPMLLGIILVGFSLLLLGLHFENVKIYNTEINPVVLTSFIAFMMGLGIGIGNPASNLACMDLMPQRASTIQGVRAMFRWSGGSISIAVITLVLQFVGDKAFGFSIVFIAISLIVILAIPFIFAMPDKPLPTPAVKNQS
jgi:EmrB/QacA subfamily drug resistance transporter